MISQEEHQGGLSIVITSEIGKAHCKLGLPNQDAAGYQQREDSFFLAVADGVGSCPRAEVGAQAAVAAAAAVFEELEDGAIPFKGDTIARTLLDLWRNSLNDCDQCCTTLKAVFKLEQRLIATSIGDGFIAISSGGADLLSPTQEENFLNETDCLSSRTEENDFWTAEFFLTPCRPYAIFCCTDGIANAILPGTELSLTKEIETALSGPQLRGALEELLRDISSYSGDDKTIGVVKYDAECS